MAGEHGRLTTICKTLRGCKIHHMSAEPTNSPVEPILAAGGIVLGSGSENGKICLVRRRRYPGEIGLPKGKLKSTENAIDAALREVREETGGEAKIRGYAGTTRYLVGKIPKAVLYFVMDAVGNELFGPRDRAEIESVEWMTPGEAILMLTHCEDRDLISAVFGISQGQRQ